MSVTQSVELQKNQDLIERARKTEVEVGVFMLLDQQPSGFIKKGTENLINPPQLTNPTARRILRKSAYAKPDPKNKGGYIRVPTEYVYAAQHIEEDKLGNAVRNDMLDQIEFRQGMKVVVGEGANVNLLRFMRKDSRNDTCDCAIPGVDKIYREVFPEKETETLNVGEFDYADSVKFIRDTFITKQTKDGYEYDDDRLRAFCNLFDIAAETAAGRVQALIATAKVNPTVFLVKAKQFEQQIYLQISHGETLGIIRFEAGRVAYVNKDKVLTTFSDKLSQTDKVKALATFFMSAEGRDEYNIYMTELEFVSQERLKTN